MLKKLNILKNIMIVSDLMAIAKFLKMKLYLSALQVMKILHLLTMTTNGQQT